MADVVDSQTRSRMMSGIRGKDTQPEILIRKKLHAKGFRYRVNVAKLPGKPDIVLSRFKAVIFVNGCFWHGHSCHLFKWPSSRPEFWHNKIEQTRRKDQQNVMQLHARGYRVMQIWECALKGKTRMPVDDIIDTVVQWLESSEASLEITGKM